MGLERLDGQPQRHPDARAELHREGEVAIAGRAGRQRLWDVPRKTLRVYPPFEPVPAAEAERLRQERRLRWSGIARAKTAIVPRRADLSGKLRCVGPCRSRGRCEREMSADPNALDHPFTAVRRCCRRSMPSCSQQAIAP